MTYLPFLLMKPHFLVLALRTGARPLENAFAAMNLKPITALFFALI